MDKSFFIKKIITQLGLPSMGMEKYYPLIDEILTKDTLPTFSQFFPYTYTFRMDLSKIPKEKETIEKGYEIYYIRDKYLEDNNLEILSVISVTGAGNWDEWNAPLQTFNVEAMILEAAASGLRSQLNLSTKSFQFMSPNRLKLRGYGGAEQIYVTVKIPYPNFGAVSPSVNVEFEKLAKLDIKMWLYPDLTHYTHIDTAEGSVDLKIDDWENAERERTDLIDTWRNKNFPMTSGYHPYHFE